MQLIELSQQVGKLLLKQAKTLAVAESCTGGMLAQTITAISGSSQWFECGWVTYSNQSKINLLRVDPDIIEIYGAVSGETVRALVKGIFKQSSADIGLAISGVAGPDGGTKEKPVGTVWLGFGVRNKLISAELFNFEGDRQVIREQAVELALKKVLEIAI